MNLRPTLAALIFRILPAILLLFVCRDSATAQIEGRIAADPIAVGYARNMTAPRVLSYARSLAERLEIGEEILREVPPEATEKMASRVEEPIDGVAWYMVQGLLPSFEAVTFRQVADEADAERLVKQNGEQFGSDPVLTRKGNGCFSQTTSWNGSYELAPGADEALPEGPLPRGFTRTSKIIEKDGKRYVEHQQSMTTIFRFHEGFLFQSNFEELWSMSLPTSDFLIRGVRREHDLGLQAFLNRIPIGIRQLGWNMLNSGVSTQIQQRDGEDQNAYQMRRSSADLALPLIRALLFDVDDIRGWLSFASEQDSAIRGELTVSARENSGLTHMLEQLTSGRSRFAPVLRDDAAVTIHLCVQFPEELTVLLTSAGNWLQQRISEETGQQPSIMQAAAEISEMLNGVAEHRTMELLLKLGWTETSGGVIYGGIQIDAESALINSLHDLVNHAPNSSPDFREAVSRIELDGRPALCLRMPDDVISELQTAASLRISHVYLLHAESCLWFAAGAENARDILHQCLIRCHESGHVSRTPLFSAKADFQKWLSYPQDDPSGIAGMLDWMDHNAAWFPPSPMMMYSSRQPTPLLQRVFDLGGSQEASLRIDTDSSGIVVRMSLGEAIANYMLARMISTQDAMLHDQKERTRQAQEAARKAANTTNSPSE